MLEWPAQAPILGVPSQHLAPDVPGLSATPSQSRILGRQGSVDQLLILNCITCVAFVVIMKGKQYC